MAIQQNAASFARTNTLWPCYDAKKPIPTEFLRLHGRIILFVFFMQKAA